MVLGKRIATILCLSLTVLVMSVFSAEAAEDAFPTLDGVTIQQGFVGSAAREVGRIDQVCGKGRLVILHRDEKVAYYAQKDNPVYEQDALFTLEGCRCRLSFKDNNVVMMAPESRLAIDKVVSSALRGRKETLLSMWKGKAIFYALRLLGYRDVRFEVRTPTASIGVRGTKFGAEIAPAGTRRSHKMDQMLAALGTPLVQLQTGEGDLLTRTYVFEGAVDVTSLVDGEVKRLGENDILEADRRGLGEAFVDLERTRRFVETVVEGMEMGPDEMPPLPDPDFRKEDLDRLERLNDIKQQEIQRDLDRDYQHEPGPRMPHRP